MALSEPDLAAETAAIVSALTHVVAILAGASEQPTSSSVTDGLFGGGGGGGGGNGRFLHSWSIGTSPSSSGSGGASLTGAGGGDGAAPVRPLFHGGNGWEQRSDSAYNGF
uniref:Uncharacterized protein n=1 Tax=Oryza punctata TaxID=4537 RepID=A0A0E0KQP6_ORYPU